MLHKLTIAAIAILLISPGATLVFSADEGEILGGSTSSPIKIEVFSDFQCQACRDFYLGTIRQVLQNYSSKNKVCVIYHETPLDMHRYSRKAARYSKAASRLGLQNLLMVYDALFANQVQWSKDGNIEAVLAKVLPPKEFLLIKAIVKDPKIDQAINKETALAFKNNIQSTPTTVIHYSGKQEKVANAISYASLKQFIDSKLK